MSPSSSLGLIGWTQRSKRDRAGATIATVIASSELSRIGLVLPGLWVCNAVPGAPKHERNVLTSAAGVGGSPRIATRAPWPLSPAAWSGAIPYAVRIWLGYSPPRDASAPGKVPGPHPNAGVPVRVGVPPAAATATR